MPRDRPIIDYKGTYNEMSVIKHGICKSLQVGFLDCEKDVSKFITVKFRDAGTCREDHNYGDFPWCVKVGN